MFLEVGGKEKRGILNDFDLASVMAPGSRFPAKTGWVRSGTLPFLASEIVQFPDGMLKRWYRYDLESFAWCLLWHMLEERDSSWLSDKIEDVKLYKNAAVFSPQWSMHLSEKGKLEWDSYNDIIPTWFEDIGAPTLQVNKIFQTNSNRNGQRITAEEKLKKYDELDEKNDDLQHISSVVLFAKDMDQSKGVDALEDITWIEVIVEKNETK